MQKSGFRFSAECIGFAMTGAGAATDRNTGISLLETFDAEPPDRDPRCRLSTSRTTCSTSDGFNVAEGTSRSALVVGFQFSVFSKVKQCDSLNTEN